MLGAAWRASGQPAARRCSRSGLYRAASSLVAARVDGPELARTAGDVEVGQRAAAQRTFAQEDVEAFAEVTCDRNPIHLLPTQDNGFGGKTIVHGMLCAGLIPALFADRLPGAIYASQTLDFRHPVHPGDTVRVEIIVERKKTLRGTCVVQCKTEVAHLDGRAVVAGTARVMLQSDRPATQDEAK
ncbi:Hydroxyacyl-thioester dehydratase type 2, mitochondrial [Hondaea fermentalgiana]|uniref:Hydroxyacyl-thioester dehydratase type 2, mitochondrial n=1 Tax=Hondaea fermentalgiana TaxID=2315210 RepID=A0A2R5GR90_9STRA|nr:Hydroxyacyl-thioester dehydratase type 2, mitochondrial [Hondaea fermentalgiana]|eukprot:GBG33392.1 Hydroxyacyl-thioester dehydratase type 2, mitochondrial [Hondaea fermentalgiana]